MSRRAYIGQAHGQLHYRQAGNPEGPALLLLHQAPSHSAMYEALMAELEDEYYLLAPDLPGFAVTERLDTIAPHPLATLRFDGVRLPASARIGAPGAGFKIAMSVLDVFRSTVGAAALGFERFGLCP